MATLPMNHLAPALILLWLTSFLNLALAGKSNFTLSYQSWDDVPACAQHCIVGTLIAPNLACDAGNYTCLCLDFDFDASIDPCFDTMCSADVAYAAEGYVGNGFCYDIPAEALASVSASALAISAATSVALSGSSALCETPSISSTLTETLTSTIGTITATSTVPATTLSHSFGTTTEDPTSSSTDTSTPSPTDPPTTSSPSTTPTTSSSTSPSYQTDTGDPMATTTPTPQPSSGPNTQNGWIIVVAILGTLLLTFSTLWIGLFFLRWRRRRRINAAMAADAADATEGDDINPHSPIVAEPDPNTGAVNNQNLQGSVGNNHAGSKDQVLMTDESTQTPKRETMTSLWRLPPGYVPDTRYVDVDSTTAGGHAEMA